MKNAAVAALVCVSIAVALPARAAPADPPVDREASLSVCASFGRMANTIMRGRQTGVQMSALFEVAHDRKSPASDTVEKMIIAAYDEPRMVTQEMQDRAVEDFENEMYLRCVKRVTK